ncbi:MAG: hypothetical protein DHS20C05_06070 [Hyphococcus sp.]|nr:MAG: hypothetical protein DHS20C05_06070 [Marinicaulis sp.]
MMFRVFGLVMLAVVFVAPANAQEREGDYLYKVSTVRAATGKLEPLLEWAAEIKASDYYKDAGGQFPFMMRHSQGDQWDLMIISPMESWTAYHSKNATKRRNKAAEKHGALLAKGDGLFAFDEDHFAYGPPLSELTREYSENGFYHIEMFKAAPGKAAELTEQRRMENAYLAATGQTTNMIFTRAAGSDVDVFTIGFHESLKSFAADAPATPEEKEQAAKDAGFKDRSDISFYLRSLLSDHHDTLAVKVE